MKRTLALTAALAFSAGLPATALDQGKVGEQFKGYEGTFVLLDTKTGDIFKYNELRANKQFSPCSTFKIFNSLVGLETAVLSGKDHSMKWDGRKRWIDAWNADQTLQSAITNSTVWYFQSVAGQVGAKRMQKYIDAARYGNRDTSGGITQFWLGNSLKISANEQIKFIERLCANDLPFSPKNMQTVRDLIRLQSTERGTLHGKTGTDGQDGKIVFGWFVGYVEKPDRKYIFATNISAADHAWGKKAREITERILQNSGIL